MFNDLVLGASFSPEYCKKIGSDDAFKLLKIVNTNLGIKDIRLGVRWNVVDNENRISLSYYDKYIRYVLKNSSRICLNIGPIKVFRWPEEHIPNVLKDLEVNKIKSNSELAKHSFEYLNNLLSSIKQEYGDSLKDVVFQLDNEPFYKFGRVGITMSNKYVLDTMKILKEYFPNNKVMINSAGRRNIKRILKIFQYSQDRGLYNPDALILGFNYYFRLPNRPLIEPLSGFDLFNMSIKKLKRLQKTRHFGLEISEGQFEPWGRADSPGNSFSDFKYLLDNCYKYFPTDYEYKLLRLWGVEKLALKIYNKELSSQYNEIIKQIKFSTIG